jgi:adenylyl- and sulfurtransferase ThiI
MASNSQNQFSKKITQLIISVFTFIKNVIVREEDFTERNIHEVSAQSTLTKMLKSVIGVSSFSGGKTYTVSYSDWNKRYMLVAKHSSSNKGIAIRQIKSYLFGNQNVFYKLNSAYQNDTIEINNQTYIYCLVELEKRMIEKPNTEFIEE